MQDLEIQAEGPLELTNLGLTLREYKIFDRASKRPYLVTVDGAGRIVDRLDMLKQNNDARFARFGSLSEELYEKVKAMGAKETLEVTIWIDGLADDPYDRSFKRGSPGFDESYGKWESRRTAAIKAHRKSTEQRLAAAGVDVFQASDTMPMVSAKLGKGQLMSLSKFKGVTIELEPVLRQESVKQNQSTKFGDTTVSDGVWEGPRDVGGTVGSGVGNVAVVDYGSIDFAKITSMKGTVRTPCAQSLPVSSETYRHMLNTASVIVGNTWGDYEGAVRDGKILAATICDDGQQNEAIDKALGWANSNGALVANLSVSGTSGLNGEITALGKIADTYFRDRAIFVVAAAGDVLVSTYVKSPANSHNTVAVGASTFGSKTAGAGVDLWTDDGMASYSAWKNTASNHNDKEKPDLVAPGGAIREITVLDQVGAGEPESTFQMLGTSYAAPVVSAVAGLLAAKAGQFAYWPELTKATLAATAWQNVEGKASPLLVTSGCETDANPIKDGFGAVNAARAFRIAQAAKDGNSVAGFPIADQRWGTGSTVKTDTTYQIDSGVKISANIGDTIRVALSWSSSTTNAGYQLEPSADLDLEVTCPAGAANCAAKGSYTYSNTTEFVEFVATATGQYTAKINRYRLDDPSTYWGMAADVLPGNQVPDRPVSTSGSGTNSC